MSNNSAATSTTSAGSPLPFAGSSPLSGMDNGQPSPAPEPMEEDTDEIKSTPDAASSASGAAPLDVKAITKAAQKNLVKLEENFNVAYAAYLSRQLLDPTDPLTKSAFDDYILALNSFTDAKEALQSFQKIKSPKNTQDDKTFSRVPKDLPFLQLSSDTPERQNYDTYDSVYDFCNQFRTVLNAHSLDLDLHWKRLLPLCLNKNDRSWFNENLEKQEMPWKQAETLLLDHLDTPYRKFLLMINVNRLRQGPREPCRAYGARFQKLRRQADMKDGVQLVLMFYCSLRASTREKASSAIASQYGTKLPNKLEDMIQLVAASDSDYLASGPSGDSSLLDAFSTGSGNKENERYSKKRNSSHFGSSKDSAGSKRPFTSGSSGKKPCSFCGKTWFHGHRCEEFKQAQRNKISRMAKRGGEPSSSSDEDEEMNNNVSMARLALDCKSANMKDITRDFKNIDTDTITFPITIDNSIRTFSLFDCGANFSSVDYEFCRKNNIKIKFINHVSKDQLNKHNFYNYFIRSADKNTFVKRIGTCELSVGCNNKTIKRVFEVMNLAPENNSYQFSIGTDCMSLFGIGIYGLPTSYDDHDSQEAVIEADKRYNNTSELLESIEAENKLKESCPACPPNEYKEALDYIQPAIKANQAIPKGSFCTIPESVVSLDTPPNVTAYRKPYPVPLKMESIVDDQVKEWLDNGITKIAPANTEWNTPLTVVKKTDAKGQVKGYRVCHDPRHINCLLKSIDRMPLPIISELLEDLKGATVYSTLDLKSAFNSLKLNPKDAHKLSFTWRGVQYQPIGTVFGIRHVSSQFQRTMSIVLEGLPCVRYFVDDIVCASKSIEEHKEHLNMLITRLTEVNLKLNPDKCCFFQKEIYLLGFRVTPSGVSVDRRKLVNVLEFPQPKIGKDIMRYCGLINYFRSLIPNVSAIMSPLDSLRNEKSLDKLWNDNHQKAFDNLKKALISDTVLAFPDMNAPFSISCDASLSGIGAVLYQENNGTKKFISFVAKSLSKSERKYSATKRELLALVFSLKKFHKYVYGSKFTLYTDHKALTYLHTQKIANLMMISWMDTILQYDFDIVHLPGISNVLPDTLSRLFEDDYALSNELGGDKFIMRNRAAIMEPLPSETSGEYFTPPTQQERDELLKLEHVKGHFGVEAVVHALKRKGIFWSSLKKDANELIKACVPCQRHNIARKGYNPLRPVLAALPGDSWGIDLAGPFVTSRRGNHYLLVMIDIATKYYVLRAIPDKTAAVVASVVLEVICTFGPFRKLQSDKATEFVNRCMSCIKSNIGFDHALISQYHPRSNGATERAVQSAVKTIKKKINGNIADWDIMVASTQLELNCKYNSRTKSTPFSLMFGRNPNDFTDYKKETDKITTERTNKELHNKIKLMREIVYPAIYEQTKKVTDKQKEKFDASHKLIDIPVGATVMILIQEKQNKLYPNYEGYYTVVRKTSAGTYVLRNEKGFIEPRNFPPSNLKIVSDKIIPQEQYFEVEAIIGHRRDDNNKLQYRCRWLGYNEADDTWEPEENFTDPKFISDYYRRIGEAPESIKAINKANKRKLNEMKDLNHKVSSCP
ncbi:hypothetical protein INT45_003171, partial [Circinella minor]